MQNGNNYNYHRTHTQIVELLSNYWNMWTTIELFRTIVDLVKNCILPYTTFVPRTIATKYVTCYKDDHLLSVELQWLLTLLLTQWPSIINYKELLNHKEFQGHDHRLTPTTQATSHGAAVLLFRNNYSVLMNWKLYDGDDDDVVSIIFIWMRHGDWRIRWARGSN